MDKKYKGIVIPSVTPLTPDLQLDVPAAEKLLAHFHEHHVSPFILGTTGEAPSLTEKIKLDFIELAGRVKQNGALLYAGISSNCLNESIRLARHCFDSGVDVVAATLPSYYLLSEQGMLRYFEQLANAVPGPLIVYNIPATTHMSIPLEVIEVLSRHENIVGTKDSERNEERLTESLIRWSARPDFSHFLGWAPKSAVALQQGGDGLIPSTGNLHPGLYRDLYAAVQKGATEKAEQLQHLSDRLGNLYQSGRTLGESLWALKVLMAEAGICQPVVMPPLYNGTGEAERQLRKEFNDILEQEEIILT